MSEAGERETKRVKLTWLGEGSAYRGGVSGEPEAVVDGSRKLGPGPMDTLLVGLCGCMAADVQMILEKGRVPFEALEIEAVGIRAPSPPRRFESIRLTYWVTGPLEEHEDKLRRAVQLSRDTYCSVLHTLRPDIDFDVVIERR